MPPSQVPKDRLDDFGGPAMQPYHVSSPIMSALPWALSVPRKWRHARFL